MSDFEVLFRQEGDRVVCDLVAGEIQRELVPFNFAVADPLDQFHGFWFYTVFFDGGIGTTTWCLSRFCPCR